MSYINTVTIMSNVTTTYINENASAVYKAIHNKIASVTGWTKNDVSTQLYVGTDSKQLRISISFFSNPSKFGYEIYSQNDNGNVEVSAEFLNSKVNTSNKTLYLHYCKSKSGKTIGIGLSTNVDAVIDFIIAEDMNGDFSAIGLNDNKWGTSSVSLYARMIWNGHKCKLSNTESSNTGTNYGALQPVIDSRLSTSVCKMPNFLSNTMFKELYMILSLPIDMYQLKGVVLNIEGKKYQGCYSYDAATIVDYYNYYNTLAILAE